MTRQDPPADPDQSGPVESDTNAQRIGDILRRAREAKQLSIEEVSRQTRVRSSHLKALESGDLTILPGPTFAIGFLRIYVQFLNLPEKASVEQFTREIHQGEATLTTQFFPPPPSTSRSRPNRLIVALGLIGLVILFLVYEQWFSGRPLIGGPSATAPDPTAIEETGEAASASAGAAPADASYSVGDAPYPLSGMTPQTPESMAMDDAETAVALPPPGARPGSSAVPSDASEPENAQAAPDPVREIPIIQAPDAPAQDRPAATGRHPQQGSLTSRAPAPVAETRPVEDPPADEEADDAPAATDEPRVVLVIIEEVWMRITDPTGERIKSRIMHVGERFEVPNDARYSARIGNAGGVQVWLDGQPLPPLGQRGMVASEVDLRAASLERRFGLEPRR